MVTVVVKNVPPWDVWSKFCDDCIGLVNLTQLERKGSVALVAVYPKPAERLEWLVPP